MVYISTDYVFDETNEGESEVDVPTNPQNEYVKANLAGEKETLADYYIIWTSWTFGKCGKNFVYMMFRLAKNYDKFTIVNDQFGCQTWTRTLAEFMTYLVDHNQPFGTYQLSNENS